MTSHKTHPEQFEGADERDGWQDCQGGEIASCVQNLVSRRRSEHRASLLRSTVTVAGLLVVIGLGSLYLIPPQPALARISCSEVHDLSEQYVAHELDGELTARIEKHLGRCRRCHEHVDSVADRLRNALSWLRIPLPVGEPTENENRLLALTERITAS